MKDRLTFLVAVVGIAIGCDQQRALPYKTPPIGSYKSETHQVKIGDAVDSILVAIVVPGFFRSAEIRPLLGRLFVDGDFLSSSAPVAVLSHDLWAGHFASARTVIGQEIEIDAGRVLVLGVMPPEFNFPKGTQLWIPQRPGSAP
ncbi:MAG: ABC transporter permease [Gemmatimonadaceae bacterium]